MSFTLTKKQKEARIKQKVEAFQKGFSELTDETGITIKPALIYGRDGIRPVINYLEVGPKKKSVTERAVDKLLVNQEEKNEHNAEGNKIITEPNG